MPFWIKVRDGGEIGMFASSGEDTTSTYKTKCNSDMSEMDCGYLESSQIASVVSIIFGGLSTIIYFLPPNLFATITTFFALLGSLFQSCFAIITCVLWRYFKVTYYTDDGINREYPSTDANDLSHGFAYYMWIVSSALLTTMTIVGFFLLYRHGKSLDNPKA